MKSKAIINLLWSDADIGGAEVYARKVAHLTCGRVISLRGSSLSELLELFTLLFSRESVFVFHDFRASMFSFARFFYRHDTIIIHGPTTRPKLANALFTILSNFVGNVISVNKGMLSLKHVGNIIYLENEANLPFSCDLAGSDFVYFGRINESKGVRRLCKWWSEQDFSLVLHLIGDGPSLGELSRRYQCKNIRFHGPLSHEDMRLILEECCFYISLSEREGLSLALAEAMSVGLIPIVMSIPSQLYLGNEGFPLIEDEISLSYLLKDYLSKSNEEIHALRNQVRVLWADRNPGTWTKFWEEFPTNL
ncbi:MAG: glycosyltransferase [Porticoccaceae bacterium]|nr:glycosyltransferase [Porticoccaceae bacterium]